MIENLGLRHDFLIIDTYTAVLIGLGFFLRYSHNTICIFRNTTFFFLLQGRIFETVFVIYNQSKGPGIDSKRLSKVKGWYFCHKGQKKLEENVSKL